MNEENENAWSEMKKEPVDDEEGEIKCRERKICRKRERCAVWLERENGLVRNFLNWNAT